jgi:hypothetical protein
MLSSVVRRRLTQRLQTTTTTVAVRAQGSSSSVEKGKAVGDDGRHEVWREGINDHDNAPK